MPYIEKISCMLWSEPIIIYMLLICIIFFIKTKMYKIFPPKKLFYLFRFKPKADLNLKCENQSQLKTFFTSIGATIGTGSVVGAAAAVSVGGSGALVWMWISTVFCSVLAFGENVLGAVFFDKSQKNLGASSYIKEVSLFAAAAYAVLCVLSSFGMGNSVQVNAAAQSACSLKISPVVTAAVFLCLFLCLAAGSSKAVFSFASAVVPMLSVCFLFACGYIIISSGRLAECAVDCIKNAFCFKSAAGAVLGTAISVGVRRGVFSNEAGLGSTVSVHSFACENKPACVQGVWSMAEAMFDTCIVTTFTVFAVLCSSVDLSASPIEILSLTFENSFGRGGFYFTHICVILFALASASGWYCIGLSSWKYIFKGKGEFVFGTIYSICAAVSCFVSMQTIWNLADIFNSLMLIINSSCIMILYKYVKKEVQSV